MKRAVIATVTLLLATIAYSTWSINHRQAVATQKAAELARQEAAEREKEAERELADLHRQQQERACLDVVKDWSRFSAEEKKQFICEQFSSFRFAMMTPAQQAAEMKRKQEKQEQTTSDLCTKGVLPKEFCAADQLRRVARQKQKQAAEARERAAKQAGEASLARAILDGEIAEKDLAKEKLDPVNIAFWKQQRLYDSLVQAGFGNSKERELRPQYEAAFTEYRRLTEQYKRCSRYDHYYCGVSYPAPR